MNQSGNTGKLLVSFLAEGDVFLFCKKEAVFMLCDPELMSCEFCRCIFAE